jgi:hypothetical protein
MNDDDIFDLGDLSDEPDFDANAKRWVQGWARRRFYPARSKNRPPAHRLSASRTPTTGLRPVRPLVLEHGSPTRGRLSPLHGR